jgi:hypothetical protein
LVVLILLSLTSCSLLHKESPPTTSLEVGRIVFCGPDWTETEKQSFRLMIRLARDRASLVPGVERAGEHYKRCWPKGVEQ